MLRDSIPAQWRASATCKIEAGDNLGALYPTLTIRYERPETDDEVRSRVGLEMFRLHRKEVADREHFERLKERFDPGGSFDPGVQS